MCNVPEVGGICTVWEIIGSPVALQGSEPQGVRRDEIGGRGRQSPGLSQQESTSCLCKGVVRYLSFVVL